MADEPHKPQACLHCALRAAIHAVGEANQELTLDEIVDGLTDVLGQFIACDDDAEGRELLLWGVISGLPHAIATNLPEDGEEPSGAGLEPEAVPDKRGMH